MVEHHEFKEDETFSIKITLKGIIGLETLLIEIMRV